jgi:hypothetical protein
VFAGTLKCQCRPCERNRGHDYVSRGRNGANKGCESAHRGRRCTQRGCESTALSQPLQHSQQAKRVLVDCRGFDGACRGRESVNRGRESVD